MEKQGKKSRRWWFSSVKMTVFANETDGVITDTSPITRRFIGQHIKRLVDWMKKQGDFKYERLSQ